MTRLTVILPAIALFGLATPVGAQTPLERVRTIRDGLPGRSVAGVDARSRALLTEPLTLSGALEVAVRENRSLRATLRELGLFDGAHQQAGTLPNPEFELDLRQPEDAIDPLQAEVFIGFDLTHALLAGLRAEVADKEREAARREAASQLVALEFEVRSAFLAAQEADQALGVAMRSLDALGAARDAMRALSAAGNVPELDLATQEAAWEEARLAVSQFELARVESFERLRRALGLHGSDSALRLSPSLPALPHHADVPDDLESRAVTANLALAALSERAAAAAARTRLANARGFVPDVTIDAHAEQDGARWEVGGGLSFTLPVFDRRQGDLLAAESAFDGLEERVEATATDLRSAARALRARVVAGLARARHLRDVVLPARRRVTDQTLRQYNAMQVDLFRLVGALRTQLDAEVAALAATRAFWTADAALRALLDGRLVDAGPSLNPTAAASSAGSDGGH